MGWRDFSFCRETRRASRLAHDSAIEARRARVQRPYPGSGTIRRGEFYNKVVKRNFLPGAMAPRRRPQGSRLGTCYTDDYGSVPGYHEAEQHGKLTTCEAELQQPDAQRSLGDGRAQGMTVSYTHLTLPTICSV